MSDIDIKIKSLATLIAEDCKKYYPPSRTDELAKSNTAINIACMHAIRFKQNNSLNLFKVIKTIRQIRREIKKIQYPMSFVNDLTLFLVKALMRKPEAIAN